MPRRSSSKKSTKAQLASRKAKPAARPNSQSSPVNSYLLQLGEKLRAVRARRGMSLRQLAKESTLSARFLAKVGLGRSNISFGLLHQVALELVVHIETLAAYGQLAAPPFEE